MMRAVLRALLFGSLAAGCTVDDVDLTGKGCSPEAPCPDGLACVAGVCQASGNCAFSISNFRRTWETPNGVRWAWTPQGDPESFVQYKLLLGKTDAELEAARELALAGGNDEVPGGNVWTRDDNPELGEDDLGLSLGDDPVIATTTDGLAPATEYRARLLVFDTAGCTFESETALALTRADSTLGFTLFDDSAHPEGGPRPSEADLVSDAAQAYEGDAYVHWPGWPDDGSVPDGEYEYVGVYQLATDPDAHYPVLDFGSAFVELAIAVDGAPLGAWGDVRVVFGPAPGSCDGIEVASINGYAFRPGNGYQIIQAPLKAFDFKGQPLEPQTIASRSLCEVSIGRAWALSESVRVDAVRLRW